VCKDGRRKAVSRLVKIIFFGYTLNTLRLPEETIRREISIK
jgi:hypothetical protein